MFTITDSAIHIKVTLPATKELVKLFGPFANKLIKPMIIKIPEPTNNAVLLISNLLFVHSLKYLKGILVFIGKH